jgi:comEA protein
MRKSQCFVSGIVAVAMSLMITSVSPGAFAANKGSAVREDSSAGVVNINTATAKQLSLLPGIGSSKAQAIIGYRSKHEFKKIEELARVKGIGRKTVKKLRSFLTVSGETTLKKKAGKTK